MSYLFFLFLPVLSYYKEDYKLILSSSDLSYLSETGLLTHSMAEEIWDTLILHAEASNPSLLSQTGFEQASELTLFGIIPLMSLIVSLGSSAILIALFWLQGIFESSESKTKSICASAFCSFVSITMSYSLYTAYGLVIVTFIQMIAGLNFLHAFLVDLLTIGKIFTRKYEVFEFSNEEAGIATVLAFIGYYYSLYVSFPLFQVPFYAGILYLLRFGSKILDEVYLKNELTSIWAVYSIWSILTILYFMIFQHRSFILYGDYALIDFRFLGFIITSVTFTVCFPVLVYQKYCIDFRYPLEKSSVLLSKLFEYKAKDEWLPYHRYVIFNLFAFILFFCVGLLQSSIPMLILGYLGAIFSMLLFPANSFSNVLYQLLMLFPLLLTSILGHISDPHSLQFTVFYPQSYLLPLLFTLLRLVLLIVSIIAARKFRETHFLTYGTKDLVIDFVICYLRTISLVVISESESSIIMSWILTLALVINIEPALKISPGSPLDDILKSFCLLLYGIRLSLISYGLTLGFYSGVFLVFLGTYRVRQHSSTFKIVFYVYFWIVLQFSCCLHSWLLFVSSFIVSSLVFQPASLIETFLSTAPKYVVLGLVLYYFTSLSSVCYFTLSSHYFCGHFLNPIGTFPEKSLILSLISLVS
jgi:hypothetical protein